MITWANFGVLEWSSTDRVSTEKIIRAIDWRIDWAATTALGTSCLIDWAWKMILEPLGHSHRPVIVVSVDRRASSLDGGSLGSSNGAGRGGDSVVADSMSAAATLTVREGGELAGFVQKVVVG